MTTTREIAGIEFACDKLPGDEGLALFLRTSAALRSARGLFTAIAEQAEEGRLIHEFFEFTRDMDPAVIHPLIMELSRLPKPADGRAYPDGLDLQVILELAFFGTAVNFGALIPAGIDPLFRRARGLPDAPAGTDSSDSAEGAPWS